MNKNKQPKNDDIPEEELEEITEETFKHPTAELEDQLAEAEGGWKRALADYQNLQKETQTRISEYARMASEDVVTEILPVMDNFSSAFDAIPEDLTDNAWVTGMQHIHNQLWDVLKARNVERIETIGSPFDPNRHEAIEEIEAEGVESGEIAEEIFPGYEMEGKVLRPARVKIAK